MMGIFKRKVNACDKPIEERSIPELIESVKHINPMNSKGIIEDWNNNAITRKFQQNNKDIPDNCQYWMNPNNQTSFIHGHLSHQDFIDWANGTGVAVRGETQEQKDKYMRYAVAHDKLHLSIFTYSKTLWMLDSSSNCIYGHNHMQNPYINNINLSNNRESAAVIKETFNTLIQPLLSNIKDNINNLSVIFSRHSSYMDGVCHTLAISGHGYWDARNTPCELENLSWSKDLVFAKAYSLYLEEEYPGLIECITWCDTNKFKLKA
jgi:hypothetical protein